MRPFWGQSRGLLKGDLNEEDIENLEEALEEARTRRALEAEEEGRRKSVHAAVEGETMPEQSQDVGPRRDRRPRRDPVCWGCGELGHVLRECPLWHDFKKDCRRKREGNVRRTEDAVVKEALNSSGTTRDVCGPHMHIHVRGDLRGDCGGRSCGSCPG